MYKQYAEKHTETHTNRGIVYKTHKIFGINKMHY